MNFFISLGEYELGSQSSRPRKVSSFYMPPKRTGKLVFLEKKGNLVFYKKKRKLVFTKNSSRRVLRCCSCLLFGDCYEEYTSFFMVGLAQYPCVATGGSAKL